MEKKLAIQSIPITDHVWTQKSEVNILSFVLPRPKDYYMLKWKQSTGALYSANTNSFLYQYHYFWNVMELFPNAKI